MKFDVFNRFTRDVQFTAEIDCDENASRSIKLGLAVKWALKNDAYLADADLTGANLARADLTGADLTGANLAGSNLADAYRLAFQIPQEGELIVWKKLQDNILAKLRIPPEAKRTASIIGRKCRAEFVEVLEIVGADEGVSQHDNAIIYKAGKTVKPDKYNNDPRIECANGIHFFLSKEEAADY